VRHNLRAILQLTFLAALVLVLVRPFARTRLAGGQTVAFVLNPPAGRAIPTAVIPLPKEDLRVEVTDGVARLWQGGRLAWQSEPDWDVRQAFLADLINDGRPELVLALWKPFTPLPIDRYYPGQPGLLDDHQNANGLSSHLFLYGWQREAWRARWCGSALARPIVEMAAGDVDGDGQNELVVLEGTYTASQHAPARRVTVWRWNGWGFSQQWYSDPARYRALALRDVDDDGVADVVVYKMLEELDKK